MTIRQILKKHPIAETELLLGDVLKQSKEFLYLHPEQKLTRNQQVKLQKLLKSREDGLPIAYLLGYKDFYGLSFKVSRSVLIPRPESEWLVERALEILKSKRTTQIIDVGTGSGCLAVSIKKNFPKARVTATDVSTLALVVAKQNAHNHGVKIEFRKQNLLQGDSVQYDLIIANLPYVPKKDYKKFLNNLKHEPKLALIDNKDDFSLYRKLLAQAQTNLSTKGTLLLEIDPTMKPKLITWQKKNWPSVNIKFIKDLNGFWRFCEINNSVEN